MEGESICLSGSSVPITNTSIFTLAIKATHGTVPIWKQPLSSEHQFNCVTVRTVYSSPYLVNLFPRMLDAGDPSSSVLLFLAIL